MSRLFVDYFLHTVYEAVFLSLTVCFISRILLVVSKNSSFPVILNKEGILFWIWNGNKMSIWSFNICIWLSLVWTINYFIFNTTICHNCSRTKKKASVQMALMSCREIKEKWNCSLSFHRFYMHQLSAQIKTCKMCIESLFSDRCEKCLVISAGLDNTAVKTNTSFPSFPSPNISLFSCFLQTDEFDSSVCCALFSIFA